MISTLSLYNNNNTFIQYKKILIEIHGPVEILRVVLKGSQLCWEKIYQINYG